MCKEPNLPGVKPKNLPGVYRAIYRELPGVTGSYRELPHLPGATITGSSPGAYREYRERVKIPGVPGVRGKCCSIAYFIIEERVGALFFFFEFGWLTWGSNLTL